MFNKKLLDRATDAELIDLYKAVVDKLGSDAVDSLKVKDKGEIVHFKEFHDEAVELLKNPGAVHGVPTGYTLLDSTLKGLEPGELIIIGAETGVGKSMLAQNILHNVGRKGIPTLFVSREMSNGEALKRYTEMEMGASGALWDQALEIIESRPYYAYKADNMTIEEFVKDLDEKIEQTGVRLVAIDHLHYFARSADNASGEIGVLVRQIKNIANKFKIPVILISHLKKLTKKGMPDMNALRDSSFIAQDADSVIMLSRDYLNEDRAIANTLHVSVQKNRTRNDLGYGELTVGNGHKVVE